MQTVKMVKTGRLFITHGEDVYEPARGTDMATLTSFGFFHSEYDRMGRTKDEWRDDSRQLGSYIDFFFIQAD